MKNELKITIAGASATGKSRIKFMIKELMEELGFDVELVLNEDHPTIENFNETMGQDIDKAIGSINQKSKIVIEEITTQKTGQNPTIEKLDMGEMINVWIEHHGHLNISKTPESEIVKFYLQQRNEKPH